MFRKSFAVLLVVLILFCLSTPAFAVGPDFVLTETMRQGLFWSISRAVGVTGEAQELLSSLTESSGISYIDVGLHDTYLDWTDWLQLQGITLEYYWNQIKSCVTQVGTVNTSSGKVLPNYKITPSTQTAPYVRDLSRKVLDYWKSRNNIQNDSDFVNMNEEYGGYISSAEGFVGKRVIILNGQNNNSWQSSDNIAGSYEDTSGYFFLGMDLYKHTNGGIIKMLSFDPTDNTITVNNNDFDICNLNANRQYVYLYFYYPIHLSTQSTLNLSILEDVYTPINNSDSKFVINGTALMTASDFEDWQSENYTITSSGSWTNSPNNFRYNAVGNLCDWNGDPSVGVQSASIPAGDYYVMFQIVLRTWHSGNSYCQIRTNQKYKICDELNFGIDGQSSDWTKEKLRGMPPVTQWSYEITDSGTGSVIGTIASPFPDILNDDEDDIPGGIYFPGLPIPDITNPVPDITIGDLNDILSTPYIKDGTMSGTPNVDPGGNSEPPVNVDLTLPSSLGLSSIWHYVEDTITYCSHYITVMFGTIIPALPTPLLNLAWASVVLGIIFGLYRRFIE